MGQSILKKYLGEAGAGFDASHSPRVGAKLYDVLASVAAPKPLLSSNVAGAIATGVLARMPITAPDTLRELCVRIDVCGSSGQTVVQARVNTVVVGTLTVDNAAVDPSQVKLALNVDVKDGDIVDINCSTAPTGGSGMTAVIRSSPVDIEV
jgi:hypothetical protein